MNERQRSRSTVDGAHSRGDIINYRANGPPAYWLVDAAQDEQGTQESGPYGPRRVIG
jgi:hypothetical protein